MLLQRVSHPAATRAACAAQSRCTFRRRCVMKRRQFTSVLAGTALASRSGQQFFYSTGALALVSAIKPA